MNKCVSVFDLKRDILYVSLMICGANTHTCNNVNKTQVTNKTLAKDQHLKHLRKCVSKGAGKLKVRNINIMIE